MVRPRTPPFPATPEGESEANVIKAKRLAITCSDAGIDDEQREELIEFWSFGETRHARDLDEKQYLSLLKVVAQIRRGKVDIRYDTEGKLYLEGPGIPVKR